MGSLSFRLSTYEDFPFYKSLLSDPVWILNSGFREEDFCTQEQLMGFISKRCEEDLKGIVVDEKKHEDIGFCHFKFLGAEKYEICGGVRANLLDKGYGVQSFVYCIDYLFKNRECQELYSIVYEANSRSRKLDLSVGFCESNYLYYDIRKFNVYKLTPDSFYKNPFTKYIINRYQ